MTHACVTSGQLLLSTCYFTYNAFFTRICAEKEWNMYSVGYYPRRVSDPQGEQVKTYRLQLPWGYSVPLIVVSILLHWLVSNTVYLIIAEGGYMPAASDTPFAVGLSSDAYVGIGYSTTAILITLVLAIVIAVVPSVFALMQFKGKMVSGGTISTVISAACHCPAPSIQDQEDDWGSAIEFDTMSSGDTEETTRSEATASTSTQDSDAREAQSLLYQNMSHDTSVGENIDHLLLGLSRRKLRWGVAKMPTEWHDQWDNVVRVGHLSFGGIEHDVQEPKLGHLYS